MRKIKILLFTILSTFMFAGTVNAATANISVSASTSQVIIGNNVNVYVTISSATPLGSWEYGFSYDQSVFKLLSTNAPNGGLYVISQIENNNTKSVTYTYVFQAIGKGSSSFSVGSAAVVDFDVNDMTLNTSSATVRTITYNEYQASLSKNNNLASLKVDGADLEPEFSKDTLEYNVKVNEDTKEINISATPEDNTASVSGTGPQSVSPGNNTFEIYVVAQNGSEKVYKINVEVIDKNPIEVNYDSKKYTVVKIRENLTAPKGFKETNIHIGEFEIPAYHSDIMDLMVVGLKDENGKVVMFTYENGKYDRYYEINLGNITIRPLEMKETLADYTTSTLKINNIEVECLQKSNEDRYKDVYCVNVETNEEGLFTVDTKDNTIMKFDKEEKNEEMEHTKLLLYVACAFAGTTFVSLIVIISLLAKKGKKPKKNKEIKKEEKQVPVPKTTKEEKAPKEDFKVEEEDDKKLSDTQKIKDNFTPVKDENIQTAEDASEDEVYDIFEDDRKRKKKKKDKKKNKE